MEKEVKHQEHNVRVICGDLFAIIQKKSGSGVYGITFSHPIPTKVSDWLEQSGIVEVQSWKKDGTMTYRRKDMFSMEKFEEVVMDILERLIEL